jgi:YidC/Oxa1 family membrane protein insertase
MLWSNVIDVLRGGLFVLAHLFGGSLGAAILVASAAVRVALLPVTLKSAQRRIMRERALRALAPELDAIKKRFAKQPTLVLAKTRELQEAHGIKSVDPKDAIAAALQFPPVATLYAAIRGSVNAGGTTGAFLWVRSLAKPDRGLALVAAGVGALIARAAMPAIPNGNTAALVAPVLLTSIITYALLSHLGAGLALYSIANSIINGVERMIAERTLKPVTA